MAEITIHPDEKSFKVPVPYIYALGCLLVAITGYLVRIDVMASTGIANNSSRIERHKEAIQQLRADDKEIAKLQLETAVRLGELAGELKSVREYREAKNK